MEGGLTGRLQRVHTCGASNTSALTVSACLPTSSPSPRITTKLGRSSRTRRLAYASDIELPITATTFGKPAW
jgi:hypothetical protein